MQKRSREGLLEILKGHRDLQKSALKAGRDNLNDFKNNLEPSEGPFESFKDTSEVESQNSNRNLNEDQFETE